MKLLIRFSGGGVRSNCASFKREREEEIGFEGLKEDGWFGVVNGIML